MAEDLFFIAHCDEKKAHEGKLIVYLDYFAGVGKTYSIFQDAQRLRKEKDD